MPLSTAIIIGNFDGVHRGHAALIQAARAAVGPSGHVIALAFEPHPRTILRPSSPPSSLSTWSQRQQWLTDAGADRVERLTPTVEFLGQSPEQFIAGLADRFHPEVIVEGWDFQFGRGRAGTIDTLRELGTRHNFTIITVDDVEVVLTDQSIVRAGSTMARWLIERGRMRDASAILGRDYELAGTVVEGEKRGRELGIPTINLGSVETMLPADGVYAGTARVSDGTIYPAAISVGVKPTFGESNRVCEAHLIGFDGSLDNYGWPVAILFTDWLRDQLRYSNVDELVSQIQRDIATVNLRAAHSCSAAAGALNS